MMKCPNCRAWYDDDTLRFCLEDGTPLVAGPVTEAPAAAFGEVETVVSPRAPGGAGPGQTGGFAPPQRARESNTAQAVILTALGMLLIFGIVGTGAWMYLKDQKGETPNSNGSPTSASTPNSVTTNSKPNTRSSPPPTANSLSNTSTAVNEEEVRNEVAKAIHTWKAKAESHDFDSYMDSYADTVDYYLRPRANRAFVRKDRLRAFERYHSMSFDFTNMDITVFPSGTEAIARFDKEWKFEGEDRRSTGKARQQMQLKWINGEWLITAERDLKVYYTK